MDIGTLPAGHHDAAVALWLEIGLTRPWNDPAADLERAVRGASSTVLGALEDDNAAATRFYERLGYTEADVVVLGRRLDAGS